MRVILYVFFRVIYIVLQVICIVHCATGWVSVEVTWPS